MGVDWPLCKAHHRQSTPKVVHFGGSIASENHLLDPCLLLFIRRRWYCGCANPRPSSYRRNSISPTIHLLHADRILLLRRFACRTEQSLHSSNSVVGLRNEVIKTGTEARSISRLRSLSNSNVRRSKPRYKKVVPCMFDEFRACLANHPTPFSNRPVLRPHRIARTSLQ